MRRALSRPFIALAVAMLLAQPGLAGPWPRAVGGVFLSFGAERDRADNSYISLYGEYGLSARNTLGFDLGRSNAGETSAILWWQRALGRDQGPNRWSISLGLGGIRRDGRFHPLGQIATAWGRGLDTIPYLRALPGGGWLAVETRSKITAVTRDYPDEPNVVWDDPTYLTPETSHKLDMTLGWHATGNLMVINQLRLEQRDDTGFAAKLAIGAVRDLWGPAKLELGLIAPLSGTGEHAVKLGTWLEF